jgi:hypothetical protein
VPLVPELPLEPEVPDEPELPEVPDDPLEPAADSQEDPTQRYIWFVFRSNSNSPVLPAGALAIFAIVGILNPFPDVPDSNINPSSLIYLGI